MSSKKTQVKKIAKVRAARSASKEAENQIKIFAADLNKLAGANACLGYLADRISKIGEINDYKTLAQFFRMAAISLEEYAAKQKQAAFSEDKDKVVMDGLKQKISRLEDALRQKDEKLEKSLKDIEDFKRQYVELRAKLSGEKEETADSAKKKIFTSILPVLDNFLLAVKAKAVNKNMEEVCNGFVMIYDQLKKNLEKEGFVEATCEGEKFDPKLHEIVQEIEDPAKEAGCIIEEVRKGYFYKDKLMRPAMVKIVK